MLKRAHTEGAWFLWCNAKETSKVDYADQFSQFFERGNSIQSLLREFETLPIELKNNHRSQVRRGILALPSGDIDIIAKRPVDKNRRIWSRLNSLFSKAEAAAILKNLHQMELAGLESIVPICALEKRSFNMVVDSWVCYAYREGEVCGPESLQDIAFLLRDMHAKGFRHGDPTWNNFLHDESGVLFTIDTTAKPCRGMYHATQDFETFRQANAISDIDIEKLGQLDTKSLGYRFAKIYSSYKSWRSKLKDKIKRNRPKNH